MIKRQLMPSLAATVIFVLISRVHSYDTKECSECSESNDSPAGGGVYTRWGRSDCPGGSELVYSGYIGGKAFNKPGSGANYLCLPQNPEWRQYTSNSHPWSGHIYGVEYSVHESKPFPKSMNFKEAPCAVCKSTGRPTTLMIPAKWTCPKDWHMEYHGYIMSQTEWPHRPATYYICVDENIEGIVGYNYRHNQGVIYNVEAVCGSLPCKKYGGHKELTCVVCSQ